MSNLKKNVEQIRKARGLSEEELSFRLGMDKSALESFLSEPPKRKEAVVNNLSRELLVPTILLFANAVDVKNTAIPDFRLSHPSPGGYARETLRWIDFAENVQSSAAQIVGKRYSSASSLPTIIDTNAKVSESAAHFRKAIGFSEKEQLQFESARTMFAALRQRIEKLNVFILQLSFPENDGTGFCVAGAPFDVIVINTRKQAFARRLFTLAHEIYHCALKETGISDSGVANNAIETRCNAFAANFLAPEGLVRQVARGVLSGQTLNLDELRQVANALNISMHATLLRLVELNLYSQTAIPAWQRYISGFGDPELPKASGGRNVEEWKRKLSKYGFKFAAVFGDAKGRGDYDELEFFKFSGIKPKYQTAYIENGSRAHAEDADVDEGGEDA